MRPVAAALGVIGAIFLVFGLYLGRAEISRYSTDCGTAFSGLGHAPAARDAANTQRQINADNGQALLRAIAGTNAVSPLQPLQRHKIADACSAALSDRNTIALAMIVPGIALIAGGVILAVGSISRAKQYR